MLFIIIFMAYCLVYFEVHLTSPERKRERETHTTRICRELTIIQLLKASEVNENMSLKVHWEQEWDNQVDN